MIGVLLYGVVCFILWTATSNSVNNEGWIWQIAYCDTSVWNWYRWEVTDEKWKYIYLWNAEWQCFIWCNCDEYYCDETSKYKYWEWYTVEDEYYKVWNKNDCYIENDIASLINYKNRK